MFNFEAFDLKLNTDYIGRNFLYIEEIDSTNSFLLNAEKKEYANGTILLAEKQTEGKGRKDRVWVSQKDINLTFSILISDKKFINPFLNIINFGTALGVAQSIENLYQLRTDMKWPNDILINDKKICGILLESSSSNNNIQKLVIGIGLNVNQSSFPGVYNIPPTSLRLETNETIDRERLLAEILNNLEEIYNRIPENPQSILNEWKNRCRMIGERISVAEGDVVKDGIFDDLDENGFLLLRVRDKIEKIHFGDVSII